MQYFPSEETATSQPFELLHDNLWGSGLVLSSKGYT